MSSASITDLIQTELLEGILTVRINRPEKKNALNIAMYGALADAPLPLVWGRPCCCRK